MAIKSGQILHDAHGFVIDRIQTGGVSNLNIPLEKIYELGNFQTVASVRDIPDLSFDLESLDVSTEIEALLLFKDPTTTVEGDVFDFLKACPMDIISPFKTDMGIYSIVRGIVIPFLTLESATYNYGVTTNASEAFTLRGDAVYYAPGSPYYEQYTHDGTTATYTLAHTATQCVEAGDTSHVLAVAAIRPDGTYRRLFIGQDYTDTTTTFTLLAPTDLPTGTILRAVYASAVQATYPQSVHQDVSVKPAAVRGKDIDVYIGTAPQRAFTDGATTTGSPNLTSAAGAAFTSADVDATVDLPGVPAGPTIDSVTSATAAVMSNNATATATGVSVTLTPKLLRWTGIQSFQAAWKVTLDPNREFGNRHFVSEDYDVPDVSGNFVVRSRDVADLFDKIAITANRPQNEVAGVQSSVGLPMELRINDPESGVRLKTIFLPDARIQTPNVQGRVQQKLDVTFNYTSDSGRFLVYQGARP